MNLVVELTADNYSRYLEGLLEIERASFRSPWPLRSFLQELANPVSHLLVLLEDGNLSGYICYWMFSGEIHVLNFAVHPQKRGRGLGRALLTDMIEKGALEGVKDIWLEVREFNAAAKGLYEKMGFKPTGRRRKYYRDTGEDAIVMTLALAADELLRSHRTDKSPLP